MTFKIFFSSHMGEMNLSMEYVIPIIIKKYHKTDYYYECYNIQSTSRCVEALNKHFRWSDVTGTSEFTH